MTHFQAQATAEPSVRAAHVPLAIASLSLGGLFLGTGEFASMSLLPGLAHATGVSIPAAGAYISAYALGVVIGAPIIAIFGARAPRRALLVGLMFLMAAGYAASAAAWGHASLLVGRFMAGLPHGAYYGVASLVAASLVPEHRRAQAVGYVMLGLAAANVIGVPASTWLGQAVGWRTAFGAITAGGLLVALLIWRFVPAIAADPTASPRKELGGLARPQVWLTSVIAAVGFGGAFAVYSYITPTLTQVSGMHANSVPAVLAVMGLGMVVGNLAGGWLADRALTPAIFGFLIWNAVFMVAFWFVAPSSIAITVDLFFIGTGFALVPALQTRLMNVAGEAQTLAAALNHCAFNISNAIGASLGGLSIAMGMGWASTGLVGSGLALGGLILMIVSVAMG
jgi:MFS transporter, DHA1 family, inner membrane transport protein